MIVAHLTDMHIAPPGGLAYGTVDTAGCLAACLAHLRGLDPLPDAVVLTGDLVEGGTDAEYEHCRGLLSQLAMPVFAVPGNHDEREAFRRAFADAGYLPTSGYLQYVVEDYPLRIVALDTVVAGAVGGALDDGRLEWLDARLAERPATPTVVMMHHPPFVTGMTYMDVQGLAEIDEFATVVARHPQVERILCGHLHRAIVARVGGTVAVVAPSTAHQLALDLRAEAAGAYVMEPPAIYLHQWRHGQGMASHLSLVGDFGPVRSFTERPDRAP